MCTFHHQADFLSLIWLATELDSLDVVLIGKDDDTASVRGLHQSLDYLFKLPWSRLSGNLYGLCNTQPSCVTHIETCYHYCTDPFFPSVHNIISINNLASIETMEHFMAVDLIVIETFHLESQMSTSWWQGVTKVIRLHHLETMIVCTGFHDDSSILKYLTGKVKIFDLLVVLQKKSSLSTFITLHFI